MKTIKFIVWTPSTCDRAPRFIKKNVKKIGKNTNIVIQQNLGLISCVLIRSLYKISLKALAGQLTSGMPKMPKSNDQPFCAHLMRHDAHIQSHPRSSPKWYICQKNWNPMKTIEFIVRTPSTCDRAPRIIKKNVKKIGKNTNIVIQQNPGLISCVFSRSLYIISLKALAGQLTSGMPKMPKSHDQPFCAHLMRHDAHIQSHPRSSPKWYICQKNWNPMKTIQVIIRTDTKHSWPSTQVHWKKRKNSGKIQILRFSKTRDLYHMSP